MSRIRPELESLDGHLRDAFRSAELPAAPSRLRSQVAALPAVASGRAGQGRSRRLRWRRPAGLLTLVGAAVVVAVVAGALSLLQGQPQPGQATPTASRSASSRTPSPGLSSQPVVIGSDGSAVLEDGPSITWTTIALSQFGSNTVWAVGAARVGETMVVAANDTFMSDTKPVIIQSTDGTRWSRVPTDGPEFAHALLDYLVAIPGGLLLVGESLDPDPLCADGAAGCMPVRATLMWRSSDGQTWQLLPTRTTAPFDRVWIASIAAGPKGLVAFGLHYPVVGSPENVVFHSPDGTSWSSAAFPYQSSGSPVVLVQQVIATSAGFVAVSGGLADEATAWYSADGLSWKRAPSQEDRPIQQCTRPPAATEWSPTPTSCGSAPTAGPGI